MTVDLDRAAGEPAAADAGSVRQRRGVLVRLALSVALVVGVMAVAITVASGFGDGPGAAESALVGDEAPPLAGTALSGGSLDLGDAGDQVVLVNFWASWCGPCAEEFPVLLAAHERLGSRGLQVVGVNSQDGRDAAEEFLADMDATGAFPHVADPQGELAVQWGVFGLPETFVVDTDGIVAAKAVGLVRPQWIRDEVEPLLEDAGP